jgi:phage shock protein A
MNDPSVAPLVAEISRLQKELDRANESIDDKIDKLEDAGLGAVGLTRKLEDAKAQIAALEDEIARLKRTEERRTRRLKHIRCQKCKIKVDAHQILQDDDR